jgi:hypothetical protein
VQRIIQLMGDDELDATKAAAKAANDVLQAIQ